MSNALQSQVYGHVQPLTIGIVKTLWNLEVYTISPLLFVEMVVFLLLQSHGKRSANSKHHPSHFPEAWSAKGHAGANGCIHWLRFRLHPGSLGSSKSSSTWTRMWWNHMKNHISEQILNHMSSHIIQPYVFHHVKPYINLVQHINHIEETHSKCITYINLVKYDNMFNHIRTNWTTYMPYFYLEESGVWSWSIFLKSRCPACLTNRRRSSAVQDVILESRKVQFITSLKRFYELLSFFSCYKAQEVKLFSFFGIWDWDIE